MGHRIFNVEFEFDVTVSMMQIVTDTSNFFKSNRLGHFVIICYTVLKKRHLRVFQMRLLRALKMRLKREYRMSRYFQRFLVLAGLL